ncbi:MAG: ABC transporter ATP-binding protein [Gemmatimonadales bacterium]|nr:ABC transporter ATP-binding protein [Gemmatimonadales bacterium]
MAIKAGITAGLTHFRSLLRAHPRLVVRFVLTSLGRSAAGLGTILLTRDFLAGVLDRSAGAGSGPALSLWGIAGLLFASFLFSSLLAFDNRVTQQRMVKVLELGMMERVIRHLLRLSVAFFDRQSHGDLLQAVRQDVMALRTLVFALAGITLEAVGALGLFLAALWLSPRLTLWALVVLPLCSIPVIVAARRALARSRELRRTGYVLFDAILQLLRGIRIIKVYGGDEAEARTTMEKGRRYFDELIEMVRISSYAQVVLETIGGLGLVIVVVVGGFDVMAGRLDWPSLLAFLLALRALFGPVNNINSGLVALGGLGASVERVSELLATTPEVPEAADADPLPLPPALISFDRVGFAYRNEPVLRDVSFSVRAGETLGIAGPSGSGKTTLLNLVARFYDPAEGAIRFDGKNLTEIRLADLYANLGIVTQEPFLFATTVRENIRCGRPAAADGEVEEAARAAGIHEEILALSGGYETVVGVGGVGLSGGQAQRINIARALVKNPPILLLDEATASLDSMSELVVQQALERLMVGRTTFVVAHRLSTLRHASRILVLEGGRIAGLGPHGELLETCPLYRRMWDLQQLAGMEPAPIGNTVALVQQIPDFPPQIGPS